MSMPGMPAVGGAPPTLYKPQVLPDIVIISILSVLAIFSDAIVPVSLQVAVTGPFGMFVLFCAALVLVLMRGTLVGFVAVMAALILYNTGLRAARVEGFALRASAADNRWFVERLLDERPRIIQTEKVTTLPAL